MVITYSMAVTYYYPDKKSLNIKQCHREAQRIGAQFFIHGDVVYELCNELHRGFRRHTDIETFVDAYCNQSILEEAVKLIQR